MKIVAFSDTHGQHTRKLKRWFYYNPGDVLLFAGDLQLNNQDDGENFIEWIHDLPFTKKVMIFGNHDGNFMHILDYVHNNAYDDINFLMNSGITINGIKFFGSPYSTMIPNHAWWFSEPDDALEKIWRGIPNNTNVLITHGPPFEIMDKTIDGLFVGSKSLAQRIKELKYLKYHIFGHIQEDYGIKKIGDTTYINASLLNDKYNMVNLPVVFDFEPDDKEYNVNE